MPTSCDLDYETLCEMLVNSSAYNYFISNPFGIVGNPTFTGKLTPQFFFNPQMHNVAALQSNFLVYLKEVSVT